MKSEEILQVVKESERSPAWRRVCSTTGSLQSGGFGICPGTRCQAFERLW